MLQQTEHAPYCVSPKRKINGTLISSEEVFIYEHNSTRHYIPPGSVCSRWYTPNHLLYAHFTLSYSVTQGDACHCISILVWERDQREICWHYTISLKLYSQISHPPLCDRTETLNHCKGKNLDGTLYLIALSRGVVETAKTWNGN